MIPTKLNTSPMKIKTLGLLVVLCSFGGNSNSYSQVCGAQKVVVVNDGKCNDSPWVLHFEDEFNGDFLDTTKWEVQAWAQGTFLDADSQEYNSLDNTTVVNGKLSIIAKKETVVRKAVFWRDEDDILDDGLPNLRTYHYTSANLWTKTPFGYGKYEIRCKIPKGKGFWPAFWTFGGPRWNEIDVFEFWNEKDCFGNYDPTRLSKNPHFNSHYDYHGNKTNENCGSDMFGPCGNWNGPDYSEDFHTFTMIWDNYSIEWYVDGKLLRRATKFTTVLGQPIDCNSLSAYQYYLLNHAFPQQELQHIIVNLAIQAREKGPDETTPFPSAFEIDYILYYKRSN